MPRNPFLDYQQYERKQKRHSYDLSHYNNSSYKLGYLYPNLCLEINFGDSVRIGKNTALGLRTFPMVFPIQTPIMVKQYYFYVRNRIIWKDWEDFIFNNKDVVHPYISRPATDANIFGTGQLGDHLGIPTSASSDSYGHKVLTKMLFGTNKVVPYCYTSSVSGASYTNAVPFSIVPALEQSARFTVVFEPYNLSAFDSAFLTCPASADSCGLRIYLSNGSIYDSECVGRISYSGADYPFCSMSKKVTFSYIPVKTSGAVGLLDDTKSLDSPENRSVIQGWLDAGLKVYFAVAYSANVKPDMNFEYHFNFDSKKSSGLYDLASADLQSDNPFIDDIHISALPFRAYEAIYRSYFQDLINEPFIIDGEQQFNRYVTNLDSGADTTPYHLFQRNWEADFLTTARPSPQQGLAPLIGITSNGTVTLEREDGGRYSVRLTTDEEGRFNGLEQGSSEGSSDQRIRRTLLELTTSGISINSIRETNALQRWLEDNWRRGNKYKDQVLAQTGVNIRYDELDMPEFIGGFSTPINVNTIMQTSASQGEGSSAQPLGDLAGTASSFGRQGHDISHFCDESGFIIGIMCIVPQPVYSQLLPKIFLKSSPLDYYNSKFGKIGMQPITYREVCPIQAKLENYNLNDVFGYQRPWYDLLRQVDTVHGQMRLTMHNFLMNRVFSSTPQLSADFLHIDPSQLNDVFTITDDSGDTIFGQTYFEIYKKQAIPRFGIPSLEA